MKHEETHTLDVRSREGRNKELVNALHRTLTSIGGIVYGLEPSLNGPSRREERALTLAALGDTLNNQVCELAECLLYSHKEN